MNYMEPSQFRLRIEPIGESFYLVCTVCQGSTDDTVDLRGALKEAQAHTHDWHDCELRIDSE